MINDADNLNLNRQILEQTLHEPEFRLRSLDMVQTGPGPRIFGIILFAVFVLSVIFVMFVPWRQSVVGAGQIFVFSPMQRPQEIEAQISGRLLQWYLRDGQVVEKGQLIAELTDIDPRFLSHTQLDTLIDQRRALVSKRDAAKERLASLNDQLQNVSTSRQNAVPAAEQRIGQAEDRLSAADRSVEIAEQSVKTTQWQLDRINALYEKGLRSQRDQQVALLDNVRAKRELQRAKAAYNVVKKDVDISSLDYKRISADTEGNINAIKASVAEANQVIASTSADIDHLDVDIQNLSERIQQRAIRAPCAGRVVRLNRVGAGETVNAGAILATIVPGTEDRAAAVLMRDYDAPLIRIGDPVRLAISGWPSLQFVGWPSVAVGTFAGRVAVIDAVDDGRHFYRIIVVPDQEAIAQKKEEPWPSVKWLRPGAKVTGWVLLRNVPVWYELWRQFNGFQPTIATPETDNPTGQSETP